MTDPPTPANPEPLTDDKIRELAALGVETIRTFASAMATNSRDWGAAADDAWFWGVVLGWDPDPDEAWESSAMAQLAERYGWTSANIARLRHLHDGWAGLVEVLRAVPRLLADRERQAAALAERSGWDHLSEDWHSAQRCGHAPCPGCIIEELRETLDLERSAATEARAELAAARQDVAFWQDQQQFAAKVAGDIADLDEQAPALRQMLGRERSRRKEVEACADKVLFVLADAGQDVGGYERMADGVKALIAERDAARYGTGPDEGGEVPRG